MDTWVGCAHHMSGNDPCPCAYTPVSFPHTTCRVVWCSALNLFYRIKELLHSQSVSAGIKGHKLGGLDNGNLSQFQFINLNSGWHKVEFSTGLWASMSLPLCPCFLWLLCSLWDSLICGSTVPIFGWHSPWLCPKFLFCKEYWLLSSLLWQKQIRKGGLIFALHLKKRTEFMMVERACHQGQVVTGHSAAGSGSREQTGSKARVWNLKACPQFPFAQRKSTS